jgi:hypothetical protein
MHTFNLAPVILAALASAAPNSNLYSQRNFGGATKAVQADGSCQEVTGNLSVYFQPAPFDQSFIPIIIRFHHVLSIKISPGSGCHFYA